MYKLKIFISALILFLLLAIFLYFYDIYTINKFKNIIVEQQINSEVELPTITKNNKIPKIIWRTHRKENIEKYKIPSEKTLKNNPGYKEIVYDDEMIEEFIKNNYSKRIYDAYKHINPNYGPARADFFRYLILYMWGGIYLDAKSYVKKNLDEILKKYGENNLLAFKGRKEEEKMFNFTPLNVYKDNYNWSYFTGVKYGEINNWCIISPKGNIVLGEVIKQIVKNLVENLRIIKKVILPFLIN